jgi:hypothetical protein
MTDLKTNRDDNIFTKKLWDKHQSNEHTHIDKDNEGVCFGCFSKTAVSATLTDICGDCAGKKGREALLTVVAPKYNGLCYFCNVYKFHIEQINARLCLSCSRRQAKIHKNLRHKGTHQVDPFWKSMRRKHGKDYMQILKKGGQNNLAK